jgi:phenylacetate-CoA ligase
MIDRRFLFGSVVANTSGTTGQPMSMRLNESYIAFDYACMFRHWSQAGYTFRAPFAAIRTYVPSSPEQPLWKYNYWQNTLYMSAYHLKPSNCERYLEALLKFRPQYIRGYPSSLNVLAEFAYPARERFDFVRGVFTASETVLPVERDNIERTFGKKLFDWYGMTEPAVVVTEGPTHNGMEVNWEYGYPEFATEPGLPPNQRKLIATSLHNPVMPFIRYETGDIATLAETPAETPERIYPKIQNISGRKDDCILTPDGGRLPSLNFYSLLQTHTDILRFQFIQPDLHNVTMKISFRPTAKRTEAVLDSVRHEVSKRLGPELALTIDLSDEFVRGNEGKTPTFLRTFALNSAARPTDEQGGPDLPHSSL